jgi:hypothetical protein
VIVQAHLAAEVAQFDSEGFVTIIKGGLTGIHSPAFPVPVRFGVFTRLRLTEDEAQGLVVMNHRLTHNGVQLAETAMPLNVNVSDPDQIYVNAIAQFQVVVPEPGLMRVAASVLGAALPFIDIRMGSNEPPA